MTKNLRTSFFLSIAFACIMTAWGTLTRFFVGTGINFIAMLLIVGVLLYLILTDNQTKSRVLDIFILAVAFTVLELIVFIVFEFANTNIDVLNGFNGFQKFLSIMGLLFLAYIVFRFILEEKGVRLGFIETILGNGNKNGVQKKAKANKELVNGSLEEKPNHKSQETEEVVIIEDSQEE